MLVLSGSEGLVKCGMNRSTPGWNMPPPELAWPLDEVHVWRTTLDWPDQALADLERCLSPDERQRMNAFRVPRDRRRYLVGRGLLRRLLGRYLAREAHELQFGYSPHGKPYLAPGSAPRRLQFSVSHSGELVLIALA